MKEREVEVSQSSMHNGVAIPLPARHAGRGWGLASCGVNVLVSIVLMFYEFCLVLITIASPELRALQYTCICLKPSTLLIPLSMQQLNIIWEIPILLLAHLALLWYTYYLTKKAFLEIVFWIRYPDRRYGYLHESFVALLTYLKVSACLENERIRIVRHHETPSLNMNPPSEISEASTSTPKPVGPMSWLYIRLSTYLFPLSSLTGREVTPSSPVATIAADNQQVVDGSIAPADSTQIVCKPSELPERALSDESHIVAQVSQLTEALTIEDQRRLLYLWSFTVKLGGAERKRLIIKSETQRELLFYLAMEAKDKEIYWDDIVAYVYEWRFKDMNSEELHDKLERDARELRNLFKKVSTEEGIPYIDPIVVKGKGPKALWSLSEAYQVIDITKLECLQWELEAVKMGKAVDINYFRALYDDAIPLIQGNNLAQNVSKEKVGNWAKKPYHHYRDMYGKILWELAEYEYKIGQGQQQEESKVSINRAAQLYERFAFFFIPRSQEELERDGLAHLSESALRQSIKMYRDAGDEQLAHRVFYSYSEQMKRRFPNWTADPKTIGALQDPSPGGYES